MIDSGSGGVNVLKQVFAKTKGFQFLFVADEKNAPYGDRSKANLLAISQELIESLQAFFHPDIVIFACNTLTATTIKDMRKKYPQITFIGCEPALKPACEKYGESQVLLLATPATIKHSLLLKKYPRVQTLAIKNLPKLIDENLFNLDSLESFLKNELENYSFKAIVLGCTHFEGIKNQLAFTQAELFSSSEGIAKRLKTFSDGSEINEVSFYSTSNESAVKFYQYFIQ